MRDNFSSRDRSKSPPKQATPKPPGNSHIKLTLVSTMLLILVVPATVRSELVHCDKVNFLFQISEEGTE